ncbi:LacI family transcriptional regulator, xylobiose transport system transcriptional regulator [Nonomuraea solani]|uniref:LacI family transcriptional regulator, xylobiose transport system transcriptional regulator n=1 Tax=Nonomuraea solani TaxID=1144553 RepID=A0A1H6F0F3_9ACTN|nr:LacI family DNA-binding transcriptional regulator [Nonomuraea solani]SEH03638.1 LacI family transcriptional regulator, xylobiose transport system transcriptional regulator [Nonomuraea solani]
MTSTEEPPVSESPPSVPLTLAQLAEKAGVSTATVSKVINGRSAVGPTTRALVERLIEEHGYRRQRRRIKPASLIEVVFHELAGDYPIEIVKGVQRVAWTHGLSVVVSELGGRHTPGPRWVGDLLVRRPAGVITVFSGPEEDQRIRLATQEIPLVVLDPAGNPGLGVPSVAATNWSGGLEATRHLLELGHRRIAMITGPAFALSSRARTDGYRAALDAAEVPVDPALIRQGNFQIEDGVAHTHELMKLSEPPTAIFAANDGQAIGVYHAAHELGLRIPDDVSVIGFDDMPVWRWAQPPLTTIHQPLREMGATAATMLISLAEGESLQQKRVELGTELVVRGSTAAFRKS